MNAEPEPVRALAALFGALDSLQVQYFVGGSLASSAHGLPRSSVDADVVADMRPGQARELGRILEAEFYIDGDAAEKSAALGESFNAIHLPTMFKIDVFPLGKSPFDVEEFRRRIQSRVAGLKVPMCTAEDIVLRKLEWYRKGGQVSERQWKDVLGVLRVGAGSLDCAYMRRWAPELGVAKLLEEALEETSSPE
jgi:hypothetical protein